MDRPERLHDLLQQYTRRSITSEDMAAIDENSHYLGIPASALMENAGASVAKTITELYDLKNKVVVIIGGTGNNGGDGFVIARHLANLGAIVRVALLGRDDDIKTEEAKRNWTVLSKMDVDIEKLSIQDNREIELLQEWIGSSFVLVDAILGTGVKGLLRQQISKVVQLMNDSGRSIVAVDTPTGLDPSNGDVHSVAVKAAVTVTFHKIKEGFRGKEEFTGNVIVTDIGIPIEAELFTGPGDVRRVVKARNLYGHKGTFGYVLIIGGSAVYSGAPALAGLASLRCGAGLSIIASPKPTASTIRSYSPNLIVHALDHDHICLEDLPRISVLLEKCDAIVLGPGIGLEPPTMSAIPKIVAASTTMKKPILIDADALRALDGTSFENGKVVLTPHAGEFRSITGVEPSMVWKERVGVCTEFARNRSCVLLLKGHETVVTDGHQLKVNKTGNPGLATAGSGDVLSGLIGALLAQGNNPFYAAAAGAFIHGAAGDLAVKSKGFHLLATDIINEIPTFLRHFDTRITDAHPSEKAKI
ncbi:MAG: NAD(P)H-hydrate dehydratase [Candidatus Bathyarchaeia archaeon]